MIAIITARGGSKRIPQKNSKLFYGRPIISYTIEAALQSGIFTTVMVSTDSEEIRGIALEAGAEVPFMRSAATSDDHATTAEVLLEVLERYEAQGVCYDTLACLYPTAPFVTGARLREAYAGMEGSGADSLMTVVRYSFPPQRSMSMQDGRVRYRYPEYASARSQDLEPIYHDCGQFYFIRRDAFLRSRSLVTDNTYGYELPEEEVQDIDTPADWEMAELKYRMLHPV